MNAPLIIFFVLAAMAVVGALSLILQRHPIHSALSLIVVMIALAGLYLLMGAEFVAAVQIIVYGGGLIGRFVFVLILFKTRLQKSTPLFKNSCFPRRPPRAALGRVPPPPPLPAA